MRNLGYKVLLRTKWRKSGWRRCWFMRKVFRKDTEAYEQLLTIGFDKYAEDVAIETCIFADFYLQFKLSIKRSRLPRLFPKRWWAGCVCGPCYPYIRSRIFGLRAESVLQVLFQCRRRGASADAVFRFAFVRSGAGILPALRHERECLYWGKDRRNPCRKESVTWGARRGRWNPCCRRGDGSRNPDHAGGGRRCAD